MSVFKNEQFSGLLFWQKQLCFGGINFYSYKQELSIFLQNKYPLSFPVLKTNTVSFVLKFAKTKIIELIRKILSSYEARFWDRGKLLNVVLLGLIYHALEFFQVHWSMEAGLHIMLRQTWRKQQIIIYKGYFRAKRGRRPSPLTV